MPRNKSAFSTSIVLLGLWQCSPDELAAGQREQPLVATIPGEGLTEHGRDRPWLGSPPDERHRHLVYLEFARDRVNAFIAMRLSPHDQYSVLYLDAANPDLRHQVLRRAVFSNMGYVSCDARLLEPVLRNVRDTNGYEWLNVRRLLAELPRMKADRLNWLDGHDGVLSRLTQAQSLNASQPATTITVQIPEYYAIQAGEQLVIAEEAFSARDLDWLRYEIACLKNDPNLSGAAVSSFSNLVIEQVRRSFEYPGEPALRTPTEYQRLAAAFEDLDYRRLKQAVFYNLTNFLADEATLSRILDALAKVHPEITLYTQRILKEDLPILKREKRVWLETVARDAVKNAEERERKKLEDQVKRGTPRGQPSVREEVQLPRIARIVDNGQAGPPAVEVFYGAFEVDQQIKILSAYQ